MCLTYRLCATLHRPCATVLAQTLSKPYPKIMPLSQRPLIVDSSQKSHDISLHTYALIPI